MSDLEFETNWEKDEKSNVQRQFIFDKDKIVENIAEDFAPLIEANKQFQNTSNGVWKESGAQKDIAEIPYILFQDLKRQGIYDDSDPHKRKFKAWLNDPDNKLFRTGLGRV